MSATSDFVPKRRFISDCTVDTNPTVTTSVDHGYEDGWYVRIHIPPSYGMDITGVGQIVVTSSNTFIVDLDTSNQFPFVAPTFTPPGPGFTPAQVVPISGVTDNVSEL